MYVAAFNLFWKIAEIKQKQTYYLALYKRFFVYVMAYKLRRKILQSERSYWDI